VRLSCPGLTAGSYRLDAAVNLHDPDNTRLGLAATAEGIRLEVLPG
jgi:hypothetical protein